jgi:hypothetical protein
MRRVLFITCASLLALTGSSGSGLAGPAAPHGPRVPPGLPDHFAHGLSAHPDSTGIYGWMPDSGIPWDYGYQYLAGGVNTGYGWETWNTQAQFPLYYAQGSADGNYIPVFPYYMLLQSTGTCDSCQESQRDLSNLNDKGLMAAYYKDFRTLMRRLGPGTYGGIKGFGRTAVVQVEPDLSGYAEQAVIDNSHCFGFCQGQANDPKLLRAAVKTTGFGDVAAYANTYQGFNLALLHLRDLYAPNVLLGFHVSDWATLYDIGSSHDPSLDAAGLGTKAGKFASRSGTSRIRPDTRPYDLVFNDVADRDAAYYKYVLGNDVFWDRLNVTFPNFARWETYLSSVIAAAGRPAIVWQIPEGNQYFDTANDTDGHYQDNRAEYFFAHAQELVDDGIIGLLFGAGNGGSTVHTDDKGDGVTNPASFCTSDGMSSGQVCNTRVSSYDDDDGGFIRISAASYYQSPIPLR